MEKQLYVLPPAGITANGPLYHPVRIGPLILPGNVFLAPVAGYSDRAFRALCVDCGASFTYTEMVSSEALTRDSGKTETLMLRAHNEKAYAVQLFGSDPERMGLAARIAVERTAAECIDINAGCPVQKIVKTGAGSSLTRDWNRLETIVRAVVKAVRVPVTVKIRSGWDDKSITWKEAACAAADSGASAVTLHPRTRAQGYEGKSNWDHLAELREFMKTRYPLVSIFGSGDLFTPEDAHRMLAVTGCDGVMFARGAMGNPFIFTQTIELLKTGSYTPIPVSARIAAGWKELLQLCEDSGEITACREMRKRFCAYSKGHEAGSALRTELVHASTIDDYRRIFANYGFIL